MLIGHWEELTARWTIELLAYPWRDICNSAQPSRFNYAYQITTMHSTRIVALAPGPKGYPTKYDLGAGRSI